MKSYRLLSSAAIIALALQWSTPAQAVPITNATVSGPAVGNCVSGASLTACAASASLLDGDASHPTGNITLNALGGALTPSAPVTTVSGLIGTHAITLQSLVHGDWFTSMPGQMLAETFIQSAAQYAIGSPLTVGQLAAALLQFDTPQAALGGFSPWQLVSDPSLSYVTLADDVLHIGLAGYLDATAVLNGLIPTGKVNGLQVSDVIKVSLDGGPAQYLYSFYATPSGLTGSAPFAMTGNYDIALASTVPEPDSMALLGLALAGLVVTRRKQAAAR